MSFNSFRDNLPAGFNGIEGEEEKTYCFFLHGEIEIEHYSEEEAMEELLDMTVRELISRGFEIE